MPPIPKPTRIKRSFKRPAPMESNPMEATDQMTVVDWLRAHKVLFSATVPDRRTCQRMGYSKGVPDIMIYDRPLIIEDGMMFIGCAIEMKRLKGGVLSPEQKIWLSELKERGWKCHVAHGCDDAIKFLKECGYGK